jgi:hypothetical protein
MDLIEIANGLVRIRADYSQTAPIWAKALMIVKPDTVIR